MKTILVVDEQPMLLKALCFKLQKAGFDTLAAVDGEQAIEFYDEIKPDLVLTDLLIPYVTGLELIAHIREKKQQSTPIIVLSKIAIDATILEVFNLGANDYVTKPFRPNEIVARTKRLLS